MSFSERLLTVFRPAPPSGATVSPVPTPVPPIATPAVSAPSVRELAESLPAWLTDEETLRDEGVLYGLSEADPDDKLAVIRAYTDRQTTPITQSINQLRTHLSDLTSQITEATQQQQPIQQRIDGLRSQQLAAPHPARSITSMALGIGTGLGAFFLIDQVLQPAYANGFVSLGVCLVGVAGPFSQPAEPDRQRAVGWLLNTLGLPLIASGFVLATALPQQTVGQSLLLAGLILMLLPTAGRLIASGLRGLSSRAVRATYPPLIDELSRQLDRLQQGIDALRAQKEQLTTLINQYETELARQNARRDALIQLFMSEFTLARSLRDRLTEAQRTALFS